MTLAIHSIVTQRVRSNTDEPLNDQIEDLFKCEEMFRFTKGKVPTEFVADYVVHYFSRERARNSDVVESELKGTPCKAHVVLSRTPLSISAMEALYDNDTIYFHNLKTNDFEEIRERILDDNFLKTTIPSYRGEANPQMFESFSLSTNRAIAIMDRSFRNIYRNEEHKKLTARKDCTGKICWQAFRGLVNRSQPCQGCPSIKLFEPKFLESGGSLKKNKIPAPKIMVQRFPEKGITCTRLSVSPIIDAKRKRVVASMEIVSSIDVETVEDMDHNQILQNSLKGILDDGVFTRSRVFIFNKKTQTLRGFQEYSLDESGKIQVGFKNLIIPKDNFDDAVFRDGKPRIRNNYGQKFEEKIFQTWFQKSQAPVWVEYPLKDGDRVLGKLVVDKYGKHNRICRKEAYAENLKQYAEFIGHVMKRMPAFLEIEKRDELAQRCKEIINRISKKPTIISTLGALSDAIIKYMAPEVESYFYRFAKNGYLLPVCIDRNELVRSTEAKDININDYGNYSGACHL